MTSASFNKSPYTNKPLRRKAYGHISHLPCSRLGSGDHHCSPGEAKILLEKTRDKHDKIIVCEKIDGSNVAICKKDEQIIPINRAGYPAHTANNNCHKTFSQWAYKNQSKFETLLNEGDWISGEWIALAHGTIYDLKDRSPFVAFDIFRSGKRVPYEELLSRCIKSGIQTVPILHAGEKPCSVGTAFSLLGVKGHYGAQEPAEGCVWRCERKGQFQFIAKYVRHNKIDGKYLPHVSGEKEKWLWPSSLQKPACNKL